MNLKKNINSKYLTAFSLIEMSVVLIVISILFVGTFSSSSVVNSVRTSVSKDKLEVIYSLLGKFLKNNKRLPCPASLAITVSNANFGKEVRNPLDNKCSGSGIYASNNSGFSNIIVGAIPVKDLGINNDFAYDAFGNLVLYFIDQRFTYNYISNISNDLNLSIPSFGTASFKDIMVIKNRNLKGEVLINSDVMMVLVSHGANGYGSINATGIQNPRSSILEELDNDISNLNSLDGTASFNRTFYSSHENSDIFDDIILFKTRNDFVENFEMMSIIPCKGNDLIDDAFTKTSVYYGQVIEASTQCQVNAEGVKRTKKCDVFGRWIDLVKNCPGVITQTCEVGGTGGMKSKIVDLNTSGNDGECNLNYSGYYSWSCSLSGGNATPSMTNNCIAYCSFPSTNGMQATISAPGTSGSGGCETGYTGYYEWECSQIGEATIIGNFCSVN